MELKFEPFMLVLYNIFKDYVSTYDEIIWENYKQGDCKEFYSLYEDYIGEEKTRVKKEEKEHIINACVYVSREVIPIILESDDFTTLYSTVKEKIQRCRFNWRTQVEKYLKSKDSRKYIIKEYIELGQGDDEDLFKKKRFNKIKEWEKNENALLSEFYYASELIKKQLNLIAKDEGVFLILEKAFQEKDLKILNFLKSLKEELEKENSKKFGATVPDSMFLYDSMFMASNKKLSDFEYVEGQDNIIVTPDLNNENFQVLIPKFEVDNKLKITFDYQESNIVNTAYDFKHLVAIFEIGNNTLLKGNDTIIFTMKDVCNQLNITPCTTNYNAIANTLYHFKVKTYKIKISDTHERIFNIINSIDKPVLNSNRELEWSIKINEDLVQEISDAKYKKIYSSTLSSFRLELTTLLFRIFVSDFDKLKIEVVRYTWSELAKRTGLVGKPNRIKKRIVDSLEEIINTRNDKVKAYHTPTDNTYFDVYRFNNLIT